MKALFPFSRQVDPKDWPPDKIVYVWYAHKDLRGRDYDVPLIHNTAYQSVDDAQKCHWMLSSYSECRVITVGQFLKELHESKPDMNEFWRLGRLDFMKRYVQEYPEWVESEINNG